MSRADRLLLIALAACTLAAWPLASALAAGGGDAAVICGPGGDTTVPLASDAVLEIDGALGTVIVCVRDGAVRVSESGCPDHVCIDTGAVREHGEVIACVPNRVIVRVGGEATDGLDARVR